MSRLLVEGISKNIRITSVGSPREIREHNRWSLYKHNRKPVHFERRFVCTSMEQLSVLLCNFIVHRIANVSVVCSSGEGTPLLGEIE